MTILISLLSPTWLLAHALKGLCRNRALVIKTLNWIYLWVSLVSVIILIITDTKLPGAFPQTSWGVLWVYFLLSRCNEVFYAFLKDARDHFDGIAPSSELTFGNRLALSLRSYLELITNFGLIYYLCPDGYWNRPLKSIAESIYFSGVTITTTGYGDVTATHSFTQCLSIYEIFCGVILLVVCFTIYSAKGIQSRCS